MVQEVWKLASVSAVKGIVKLPTGLSPNLIPFLNAEKRTMQ